MRSARGGACSEGMALAHRRGIGVVIRHRAAAVEGSSALQAGRAAAVEGKKEWMRG
ncbi:MAG: hypothetical protein ACLTDR_04790 [Adlercreutzia equolifaciens]